MIEIKDNSPDNNNKESFQEKIVNNTEVINIKKA